MATNAAADNPLGVDVEQGRSRAQHNATYKTSYVRDITYKVIPFCSIFLVVFSVGAVLVSTLAYGKPVPKQGTIVISSMLGVLFFFFCIGGIYLYHEKHYPPLTKGPNCPDRPEPHSTKLHWNHHRRWKAMSGSFQKGTKFMMMAITKKRQSSVTGTTSTASRLRRHEQEVPDNLQGRAVSPETFYARALHNNEPPADLVSNGNGQGGWLPPTQLPHSPRRYHGFDSVDRDMQPNPRIQDRTSELAYTQREVYFPPIRTPTSGIPQNRHPPAPGPTRRPLPNRHAVHSHTPKRSSHLRNMNIVTQDDHDPESAERHIVQRQYLDVPLCASGNITSPHPGISVHNEPMDSPTPRPIARNRRVRAIQTPQRDMRDGQPTSQYLPRPRPNESRPPSRTFEEMFGERESDQSPQSSTGNSMCNVPPLFAGVAKVPEMNGQLVDYAQLCDLSTPDLARRPKKATATASSPDPFLEAGGLASASSRRIGNGTKGTVSNRRGQHQHDHDTSLTWSGNCASGKGPEHDPRKAAKSAIPVPSLSHKASSRDKNASFARPQASGRGEQKSPFSSRPRENPRPEENQPIGQSQIHPPPPSPNPATYLGSSGSSSNSKRPSGSGSGLGRSGSRGGGGGARGRTYPSIPPRSSSSK
ncbi:hypothetical protein F5X99DRAFT_424165 [Biscogniauxia marginata]|nr:hypothetical protein F5X99DRAFT_424165 [Biscogniauxia marginata]